MSAHALKLKKKLEKFKINREIFEEKKRLLDLEMVKCHLNMNIISKGMKNKVRIRRYVVYVKIYIFYIIHVHVYIFKDIIEYIDICMYSFKYI